MKILGRKSEKRELTACVDSKRPEFVAVYGRRRVGKTFLIREFFHNDFAFHLTGTFGETRSAQLAYFDAALAKYGGETADSTQTWREAFLKLEKSLEKKLEKMLTQTQRGRKRKRVVFFDEIAWLDTKKSGFLSALEHFWNSWGAGQPDLMLIVCGSATSWITKKLFKNRGGLHNRLTRRIELRPFTLAECEEFFKDREIGYDRLSITECYMVFGGIPYYLDLFEKGKSVAQNIDRLCFSPNAPLRHEFEEIYASLFQDAAKHMHIIRALAAKRKLSRDELTDAAGCASGGRLSETLDDLEQSGFITRYYEYSGKTKNSLYRLSDFFSQFSHDHLQGRGRQNPHYWSENRDSGRMKAWLGYAFEQVCLTHSEQIKHALGILGVSSALSYWRDGSRETNMQIDLVIDRKDRVIDLCEFKYGERAFEIDKAYAELLLKRKAVFKERTRSSKTIALVFVAALGLKENKYSHIADIALSLDDLFV